MKKWNQLIWLTLFLSSILPLHGHDTALSENIYYSLICQLQKESHIIRRGFHAAHKIIKQKQLADEDIQNLQKFGLRTAIIAGLTMIGSGSGILLYRKQQSNFLLPSWMPSNINLYNKKQHESAVKAIVNDDDTAHKLWADEKPTSHLVTSIMGSVNSKTTYVFVENNIPQGFIALKGNHIALLAVDKNNRSHGIGGQLLSFAIKSLATKYKKITIDVAPDNRRAKALYEKSGFKFAAKPYLPGLLRGTYAIA